MQKAVFKTAIDGPSEDERRPFVKRWKTMPFFTHSDKKIYKTNVILGKIRNFAQK